MSDLDLARRAVACPRWRWLDGSQSLWRQRGGVDVLRFRAASGKPYTDPFFLPTAGAWELLGPDLDDPATVGCLEALAQAALGHDGVNVVVEVRWSPATRHRVVRWTHTGDGWGWTPHTIGGDNHASKAAALVAALEAVP